MRIETVRGPWVSMGIHIDFQRWYIDIHFIWWIITVGEDYKEKTPKNRRLNDEQNLGFTLGGHTSHGTRPMTPLKLYHRAGVMQSEQTNTTSVSYCVYCSKPPDLLVSHMDGACPYLATGKECSY